MPVHISYQPPRILLAGSHLGWEFALTTSKDPESEWLARDNLETNPITIRPETSSHAAEQFSWVPLPCCSSPGRPFPKKFFALSAHVSPWTIHFHVLDKIPLSGPGRGPPSCNIPTVLFSLCYIQSTPGPTVRIISKSQIWSGFFLT